MNIWIMRHGEASFNAPNDAARNLTANGAENVKSQGKWLGEHLISQKIQLDKIIVSPYLRAQQTLEHLMLGMQAVNFPQYFANITETWEEITPDGNPYTVENYLEFLSDEGAKNILIISHLPLVFDLTQLLTAHKGNVQFPTSTIVEINWVGKIGEVTQLKHA
ncbi:phosphohistidine phosphatase SixA [Mannheimia sp. AT1]|uniref:Phosphohistidine phosphatase SixA n=1 Tax=Mannheimia cairinae TaxID=3025936 RepID=A0ABT5MPQ5_9PAST|nr:phosphohistidine phosphatase SixA [Mannheimia cairinae]MDD0823967.1 phosphohistidine phosphatase SixA [Mannheimia cairinae]MDD0825283.1 phosphohistidine phosphatase SixA [Mannheimia cairinae]